MTSAQVIDDTQVCRCETEDDATKKVDHILESFKGNKDELIPILQHVQKEFGYLPEHAMSRVAMFVDLPESNVYGVATFYAQFKFVPTGRNVVRVCRGTACHVRGGARVLREVEKQLDIKPGESTDDLEYALETVACIGACALAPTMMINDDTYGEMNPKKVSEILNVEKTEDSEE